MGNYRYIDEKTQNAIKNIAIQQFSEANIKAPPVCHATLYDIAGLTKRIITPLDDNFALLQEEIKSKISKDIRGLLYVPDRKMVLIDKDFYTKRNNFVFGHELGHWHMPWHRALLYKCTQFDLALSTQRQLEQQANFFSSEINFLGNIFFNYLQSSPLTIKHILQLSDTFEASIEATLRRAVETEIRPCVLISLAISKSNGIASSIKYHVCSDNFLEKYGNISRNNGFNKDHVISKAVAECIANGSNTSTITLKYGPEKIEMQGELWITDWNALVLITPSS